MNEKPKINDKHVVLAVFLTAMALRLLFSFHFQKYYFGEITFQWKDTPGYLQPILNWIEYGIYQGDLFVEDSKYFRVPIYPLFIGAIHWIFGAAAFDYAVATLQILLDSVSAVLVYILMIRLSRIHAIAITSAFIYATYPFAILWTPIVYTEVLQNFLMLLLLTTLVLRFNHKFVIIAAGILCGILVLTKQYLGLLLFIPLLYVQLGGVCQKKSLAIVLLTVSFVLTLSPWVIRNYFQSGELIVLRGQSTGIRNVGIDSEAFYRFASLFDENVTPAMNEVAYYGSMTFNKHDEFVARHRTAIDEAIGLAHHCGDSFVQMQLWIPLSSPPYSGCAAEVASRFDALSQKFWLELPLIKAMETRIDSAKKIFFKSDVANSKLAINESSGIKTLLFRYRVFLLLSGFLGIAILIRRGNAPLVKAIMLTALAFYSYFSLIIVHAEMRYLLVPDLLISIFSSVPIVCIGQRLFCFFRKKAYKVSSDSNVGL